MKFKVTVNKSLGDVSVNNTFGPAIGDYASVRRKLFLTPLALAVTGCAPSCTQEKKTAVISDGPSEKKADSPPAEKPSLATMFVDVKGLNLGVVDVALDLAAFFSTHPLVKMLGLLRIVANVATVSSSIASNAEKYFNQSTRFATIPSLSNPNLVASLDLGDPSKKPDFDPIVRFHAADSPQTVLQSFDPRVFGGSEARKVVADWEARLGEADRIAFLNYQDTILAQNGIQPPSRQLQVDKLYFRAIDAKLMAAFTIMVESQYASCTDLAIKLGSGNSVKMGDARADCLEAAGYKDSSLLAYVAVRGFPV
jgi:hypothetical protein